MSDTQIPRPLPGEAVVPSAPELSSANLGSLRAVAARRPGVPMAHIRLAFALRSSDATKPQGAMLLSESALAGTKKMDRTALAAAIDILGGSLELALRDGWLSVRASVLSQNLEAMAGLISEVLQGAAYPAKAVRADRARLADELVIAKSQPSTIAKETIARRLHGNHPLATGLPAPSTLSRIAGPTLAHLHADLLTPANAVAVVVSDLSPDKALSSLGAGLGSWCDAPGQPVEPIRPLPPVAPGALVWHERMPAVQTNIRFGRLAPRRSDPGSAAASIANLAFGGMFASRLVDNLREKRGYTYSPRSEIQHFPSGSRMLISLDVANEVTAASFVELRYELGRACTTGFGDEEIDFAKRYALGTFAFSTATQAGLASILEALSCQGVGMEYLSQHPRRIADLETAEVNTTAQDLLAPSEFAAVAIGDPGCLAGLEKIEGRIALA